LNGAVKLPNHPITKCSLLIHVHLSAAAGRGAARIALAGDDRRIRFWQVSGNSQPIVSAEQTQAFRALSFSPDGNLLAAGGFGDRIQIYNVSDGKLLRELDAPGNDIHAVAFSPDGRQLAAAGRLGSVRLWNTANWSVAGDVQMSSQRIRALAYSADGKQLASGGDERVIRVIDTNTAKAVVVLPVQPAKILSLTYCGPNKLAAGCTDNEIRLWNLATRKVEQQLTGHTGSVSTLSFAGNTGELVSGSFDTTVRVWRVQK
jgi:WD40 repeat protein